VYDRVLGSRPNQKERLREDVRVTQTNLLDVRIPGGKVTPAGIRDNVSVALQYLSAWLGGSGAVAINNLMEDTATAEIARAQLWQWIRHGARTDGGEVVTLDWVRRILREELKQLETEQPEAVSRLREAAGLLEQLVGAKKFPEFLTLAAYQKLS
jgi:malate synthase